MANHFFTFKQFTVQQDTCAMKVCTDASLFGAWVAKTICHYPPAINCILDIGTGTGLLSLMLAQKNNMALIDAIEIDELAVIQAASNFQNSPWNERITAINMDVRQYAAKNKYDLIISNPPFFENDLKSDDAKRNLALHSDALSLEDLVAIVKNNLSSNGIFAVLLPFHRTAFFEKLSVMNNLFLQKKVFIKQTPDHNYFRSILLFGGMETAIDQSEIIITDAVNHYTKAFAELLKDYYLYL